MVKCKDCMFYIDGECHRHAPKPRLVYLLGKKHLGEDFNTIEDPLQNETIWPEMNSFNCCGEGIKKTTSLEDEINKPCIKCGKKPRYVHEILETKIPFLICKDCAKEMEIINVRDT